MKEFIDKLISRLEEISVSRDNDGVINGCNMGVCEDDDCLKCLKKKVISIVNQLAEEYNGGWIPRSERLPEDYTEVLGYGIDGHIYLVEIYDTKIYGKVWKQWNGGDIRLKFIDAWQPLPEPFKPKGDCHGE